MSAESPGRDGRVGSRYDPRRGRDSDDFDLPPVFQPLLPWKSQLVVAHKFFNPYSLASHGTQMATLTVTESWPTGIVTDVGIVV